MNFHTVPTEISVRYPIVCVVSVPSRHCCNKVVLHLKPRGAEVIGNTVHLFFLNNMHAELIITLTTIDENSATKSSSFRLEL